MPDGKQRNVLVVWKDYIQEAQDEEVKAGNRLGHTGCILDLAAEVERLRAENAALQADAALGIAVWAMPVDTRLWHMDDGTWDYSEWEEFGGNRYRHFWGAGTPEKALAKEAQW